MKDLKQIQAIRVSGVDQDATSASSSFTSDAIEFSASGYWSLNVWFKSLSYSGTAPQVTIEVSNNSDSDSFVPLNNAENITVPELMYSSVSEWKYMRVVYKANGASTGSKYFDLIIGKNGD
jgi:hypothetical protein